MYEPTYSCNHLDFNKSYGCVTCDNERKLASLGAIDMGYIDDTMKWIDDNNVDMWKEESILSAATYACGDGCDCECCQ